MIIVSAVYGGWIVLDVRDTRFSDAASTNLYVNQNDVSVKFVLQLE
jgi:hypothetical protein